MNNFKDTGRAMDRDSQNYMDALQDALLALDHAYVLSPNQQEDGLLEPAMDLVRTIRDAAEYTHGAKRQEILEKAHKLLTRRQ